MDAAYEMIMAAKEGHVDVVKALASEDPQVANCKDSMGQTPLMWASYKVSVFHLERDEGV